MSLAILASFYIKTSSVVYNQLSLTLNDGSSSMMITGITTNWQKYYVPFDDLGGNPGSIHLIAFQTINRAPATLYFDKVTLVNQYNGGGVPWNPNAAIMYSTTTTSDAARVGAFALLSAVLVALLL
jgi:hypothetical protein